MKKGLVIILCVAALLSSCKKEEINLLNQQVDSHTILTLNDVFFVNDSTGFICGGDKYNIGIFLKTSDGGNTWSIPDSIIPKEAYAQYFFNASEGFVGGYDTWLAHTTDSGKNFSSYSKYILPLLDISFSDRQHGVYVTGSGYLEGKICTTTNGGSIWNCTDIQNNMRSVAYADAQTVFTGGYGVIYKSTNAGATFFPLDINGDFFTAIDFPTTNTGYFAGYQRMILKTTNKGNSFVKVMKENTPFGKREHFQAIDFWNESVGFVVGDEGLMYRTTNGGESWQKIKSFTRVNIHDIHLFSANSGIVVGDEGKIFLFSI